MYNKNYKLGLVLSGGGAKGAYQAGIIRYLSEANIQPDMVSGTSIGALNGAVLSAQKDIHQSAKVIQQVWQSLSTQALQLKNSNIALSIGLVFHLRLIMGFSPLTTLSTFAGIFSKFTDSHGIMDNQPVQDILTKHASLSQLNTGLPFYVSVYNSQDSIKDISHYCLGSFIGIGTKESDFFKIQQLNDSEKHSAIMASAALPLLFNAQKLSNGQTYRDGGLGDPFNEQGNTPAQPLVQAGCTHLIVSLLGDGSVFNRHHPLYRDVSIIEIRPKHFISQSSIDMLNFKPERIEQWMEQGYEDAKRCIGDVFDTLKVCAIHRQAQHKLRAAIDQLENDNFLIT